MRKVNLRGHGSPVGADEENKEGLPFLAAAKPGVGEILRCRLQIQMSKSVLSRVLAASAIVVWCWANNHPTAVRFGLPWRRGRILSNLDNLSSNYS